MSNKEETKEMTGWACIVCGTFVLHFCHDATEGTCTDERCVQFVQDNWDSSLPVEEAKAKLLKTVEENKEEIQSWKDTK